jgi:hypothetical protein
MIEFQHVELKDRLLLECVHKEIKKSQEVKQE